MVFRKRSKGTKSSEASRVTAVVLESNGFEAIVRLHPDGACWRESHLGPTRSVPESKFLWSSSHQERLWNPKSAMISGKQWG
jgi:hypothetical protein